MDLILYGQRRIRFDRISSGTSYTDAALEAQKTRGPYFSSRITWNGQNWELRSRARDLLDQAEGVRKRMASAPGGERSLVAFAAQHEWTNDVGRWRGNVIHSMQRHLAEEVERTLPKLTAAWAPDTGKPRHTRNIEWVEPWLRHALDELLALREALGVSRNVAAVSPPSARFAELRASAL